MTVAYERQGAGEALVLIHGVGGFGRHWEPLLPELSEHFDVIAPDLPGFGDSPALPGDAVPPSRLAEVLAGLLDELGIERAHVVGHSLGGYVAFELAALQRAVTVTGLAPAGLWRERQSRVTTTVLRGTRLVAGFTRPAARPFVQLGSRFSPARLRGGVSRELALSAYDAFSTCPGFFPVLRGATETPFTGRDLLTMPVTVAFGSRDFVILPQDRCRDRLPDHTRWVTLPGLSHAPQWQHPDLVARTILEGTGQAAR